MRGVLVVVVVVVDAAAVVVVVDEEETAQVDKWSAGARCQCVGEHARVQTTTNFHSVFPCSHKNWYNY